MGMSLNDDRICLSEFLSPKFVAKPEKSVAKILFTTKTVNVKDYNKTALVPSLNQFHIIVVSSFQSTYSVNPTNSKAKVGSEECKM
ncbi:hypothetical protein HanRHA438_Chr13g0607601 [Helianthus annuus]|nr:hypothetical protein HanRHA438_Chr13g0607601 [Helianthus annuus]